MARPRTVKSKQSKDGRDVQLAVLCFKLRDVGDALFQGFFCRKVSFQQIIRLSGLPIRLCDAVGPTLWVMAHADFLHYAVNRALTGDGDAFRLLQQQRLVHPSASVSIIADILVIYK